MKKWMVGFIFVAVTSLVNVANANVANANDGYVDRQNNNAIEQQFNGLFEWALDDEIDISVTLDRLEFICRCALVLNNFDVYSTAIAQATDLEYFCIHGDEGILDQFNALLLDEGAREVDLLFKLADLGVWHRWVLSDTNIGEALRREVRGIVADNGRGHNQALAEWYQDTRDWMFNKISEREAEIR